MLEKAATRFDLTSADANTIGIDFQYFYFINELLKLAPGQIIGYEVKDDIHIELPNRKLILIQVKHTVRKSTKEKPINLSDQSEDLWKTLSNWSKVICDPNDERKDVEQQKVFAENTNFILATNKVIASNTFITMLNKHKNNEIDESAITNYLYALADSTKNENLKRQLADIYDLNSDILSVYLQHITVMNVSKDIIDEIKLGIQNKMIAKCRINDVFNDLYSELKVNFFELVNAGFHQSLTYEQWTSKYTCIFEKHRETTLPIRHFVPLLPDDLVNQNFIKELIAIGEVEVSDLPEIANYTEFMLRLKMQIDSWCQDGLIAEMDKDNFHRFAFAIWRNIHKKSHRSTKGDRSLDCSNACTCLDDVRMQRLKFLSTDLDIELCNGEFYLLSDIKRIGWKLLWEDKY